MEFVSEGVLFSAHVVQRRVGLEGVLFRGMSCLSVACF